MAGPEHEPRSAERIGELEKAAGERLKELERSGEVLDEGEARQNAEKEARKETEAIFSKEQSAGEKKQGGEPSSSPRVKRITNADREASFDRTMVHVQEEMSAPARTFSKVIHNPIVEKTSDVVGSTIARPNAILSGALAALLLVGAVYLIARNYGYTLSGSETIIAFILGWIIGIIFDFLRAMITGGKR